MCSVTRKTLGRGEKRGKRSLSNWLGPGGAVLGFNPFAGSDFLSVPGNTGGKKIDIKCRLGFLLSVIVSISCSGCWVQIKAKKPSI